MSIRHISLLFFVNDFMDNRYENLGLEYIAAALRFRGYTVSVKALQFRELDFNELQQSHPDLIGFSVYYLNLQDVLHAASMIKSHMPGVKIVLGGPHVTLYGKEIILENDQIDYGIRGEGEYAMCELVNALNKKTSVDHVSGLIYKDKETYHETPQRCIEDLDLLPFPSRELLTQSSAMISTSRGCTNNCSFCSHKKFWEQWRGRSPENIVAEMKQIYRTKNVCNFFIMDCSFEDPDIHAKRMTALCKEMIDSGLSIVYSTSFRATFYQKANDNIRDMLQKSGLVAALVGIESGNDDDLQLYNKGTTVEDNHKIIAFFRELDCLLIPSFINFNPYSTPKRLVSNLHFLRQYKQTIRFFTFLDVFSYTPIFKKLSKDGLILKDNGENETYSYNYGMNDSCVFRYTFVDKNVGRLCVYCKNIMKQMDQHTNLFTNLIFYYERHQLQVRQLEKAMLSHEHKHMFMTHYSELFQHLEMLDDILFRWGTAVLELVETGWDLQKVEQYTQDIDFFTECESIRRNLLSLRGQFLKSLIRCGYSIDKL